MMGFDAVRIAFTRFDAVRGGSDSLITRTDVRSDPQNLISRVAIDHQVLEHLMYKLKQYVKEFDLHSATVYAEQQKFLKECQHHLNTCCHILQPAAALHIPDNRQWSVHLGKEYVELTQRISALNVLVQQNIAATTVDESAACMRRSFTLANTNAPAPPLPPRSSSVSLKQKLLGRKPQDTQKQRLEAEKKQWKQLFSSIEKHTKDEVHVTLDWVCRALKPNELRAIGQQYARVRAAERDNPLSRSNMYRQLSNSLAAHSTSHVSTDGAATLPSDHADDHADKHDGDHVADHSVSAGGAAVLPNHLERQESEDYGDIYAAPTAQRPQQL